MRSVPCERSGPTRLTLSPTFLAITSASWGAIVASEPYSRASKMNDNEDLLIFSCLLLFNREAGVADSANPSPPPWRKWHAVLLPWLQPLYLSQFSPLEHNSKQNIYVKVFEKGFFSRLFHAHFDHIVILNCEWLTTLTGGGRGLMRAVDDFMKVAAQQRHVNSSLAAQYGVILFVLLWFSGPVVRLVIGPPTSLFPFPLHLNRRKCCFSY